MIPKNELRDYLSGFEKARTDSPKSLLAQGDLVKKSMGIFYEIDDTNIPEKLGYKKGVNPYWDMHRLFKPSLGRTLEIAEEYGNYDGVKTTIPFSIMMDERIGECVETHIVGQLYNKQIGMDSFLVQGGIKLPDEDCYECHAYLIGFKEREEPLLFDVSVPLNSTIENAVAKPCFLPVEGLCENGDIMLKDGVGDGRRYLIDL